MAENNIKITLRRFPSNIDWARCYNLAIATMGKEWKDDFVPDSEWRRKILKAEHSPIRTLMFTIQIENIPYFSSVHFARHKYGVEPYISTQRNDRQRDYDRHNAPQNAPVTMVLEVNAQELMHMARMRLCTKADKTTRYIMSMICMKVEEFCPEFNGFLIPRCEYLHECPEMKPCGYYQSKCGVEEAQESFERHCMNSIYDANEEWAQKAKLWALGQEPVSDLQEEMERLARYIGDAVYVLLGGKAESFSTDTKTAQEAKNE